jgi:hypothetical protein
VGAAARDRDESGEPTQRYSLDHADDYGRETVRGTIVKLGPAEIASPHRSPARREIAVHFPFRSCRIVKVSAKS